MAKSKPQQARAAAEGVWGNPYVQRFLTRSYPQSLLRAICTDPSILVVGERGRLDPVTTFMHEHHGIEVEWTEVYAGSFRVWRCAPKGAS